MAHSSLSSVADGSTNIFTVDFPYINKAYVKVYKDGALVDPSTLTWPSAGQVQLPDAAASLAGKTILRKRESPLDAALATFLAGPLDVAALNTVISQMLHLAVEARDGYSGSSVTWRGAWSGAYSYAINDIASYGGSSYRSLVSDNLNVTPGTDAAKWQLVASKGDVGTTAWGDLTGVPATFPPSTHDHDDSYYTETEADGRFVNAAGDVASGRLRFSYNFPDVVWGETGGAWRTGKAANAGASGNFYIQYSNDMFAANFMDAITITPGGNIGIRTTTPETVLDVNGLSTLRDNARVKKSSYPKVILEATGNASGVRKWQVYINLDGTLRLGQLNDAEGAEVSTSPVSLSGPLNAEGHVRPKSYTVAGVPSASGAGAGAIIYVSNETGGATIAFSDGTNWRRVIDRAVVA